MKDNFKLFNEIVCFETDRPRYRGERFRKRGVRKKNKETPALIKNISTLLFVKIVSTVSPVSYPANLKLQARI